VPSRPRSFFLGILIGIVLGCGLGAFAGWEHAQPELAAPVLGAQASAASALASPGAAGAARVSYSQQGEDIVVRGIFDLLHLAKPSYIDIGAYHPIVNSNTYLLYLGGSRGVLVEPNPAFTPLLRSTRPGDRVLPIGIGIREDGAADYYVIAGPGQDNTFSKTQADELVRQHGPSALQAVIKMPLRTLSHVLDEEFPTGGPDFFSIDIEGMDLDVLKTLDWERHRPKVFCVETTAEGARGVDDGVTVLMKEHGYLKAGGNLVNSIFVDGKLLPR
jgi:FkbM family methyltransferase